MGPRGAVPPLLANLPKTTPVIAAQDRHADAARVERLNREIVFHAPPELLREGENVRATYSQDGLHIPENLPRMTSG